MSRFFAFYMVACLILFISLMGIFTTLKVHTHFIQETADIRTNATETQVEERPAPFTRKEFRAAYPARREMFISMPPLVFGYMYQTVNPVVIYDSINLEEAGQETLIAGGVFKLTSTVGNQGAWTHFILVSKGQETYEMFMKHADLGPHDFYGPRPDLAIVQRQAEQYMHANAEMARRKAESDIEYAAAIQRYWEADALRNPENRFRAFVGQTQSRVAQMDSNGITFSATLAGVITFLVVFFLGSFSWLRATRVWESDFSIDDLEQSEEHDIDDESPPDDETDEYARF